MSEQEELASWIKLEGCFNFRDLGGYRTSDGRTMTTGQVYRSDGLQRLTSSDLDHLCGQLGLGAVIDLRAHDEVREDGVGSIAKRTTIHHVPLFPEARTPRGKRDAKAGNDASGDAPSPSEEVLANMPPNMGELYVIMLRAAQDPIVQVVELLGSSECPIVFHCAAGKDRTGIISAVLLSLLGIPEETIIADYAFSRQNIDQINARLNESDTYQAFMKELPEGAYDANPEAMKTFLDKMKTEFGSIIAWSESAGITPTSRTRLQSRLLG